MSTWPITGCSTGLGRAYDVVTALDRGHNVVATARDAAKVQGLADAYPGQALAVALDVTRDEQVTAAVAAAEERFGAVDVLVNNAGYGYRAAVEEGQDEAGARVRPEGSDYHAAAKAAVEAMTLSLARPRLQPHPTRTRYGTSPTS